MSKTMSETMMNETSILNNTNTEHEIYDERNSIIILICVTVLLVIVCFACRDNKKEEKSLRESAMRAQDRIFVKSLR